MTRAGWRRRAIARVLHALAAIALIVGQVAWAGPHTLITHYVCATHVALHHDPALGDKRTSDAAPTSGPAAVEASTADAHHDCALCSRRDSEHAAARRNLELAVEPLAVTRQAPTHTESAHSGVPLLALAPKQSPPQS